MRHFTVFFTRSSKIKNRQLLFVEMEAQKSFVFVVFISQVFGEVFDPQRAVAQAIDQMLQIYFAPNSPKIDLIYFESFDESQNIIESLMQNNKEQISFQVIDGNRFGSQQIQLNSSSILLFESSENFVRSFKSISWQDDYNDELKNHLVYFPRGLETDLDFIAAYFSVVANISETISFPKIELRNEKVKSSNVLKIAV